MLYWVIYDITSNPVRTRVSEKCKNYGLFRIQKSAFLGSLTKNRAEMLAEEINEAVGRAEDSRDAVFIIPACTSCFNQKIITGFLDTERLKKRGFVLISEAA